MSAQRGRHTLEIQSRRLLRRARPIGQTALVGGVVAALLVAIGPMPAMATPKAPFAQSAPSTGGKHGKGNETTAAIAQAKATHKRVEVVGQRGIASTTYANPDGTLTDVLTAAPTRAKATDGSLVPISTKLVKTHGRWATQATNGHVSFAAPATTTTTTSTGTASALAVASAAAVPSTSAGTSTADVAQLSLPDAASIQMGYGANLAAPTVSGDTATYTLSSTSALTASSMDSGFSEDVVLQAAPDSAPTYRFPLTVTGGLTPRLRDGTLQFVDASGAVQAISRPLQMWDAHRDTAGDPDHTQALTAALTQTSGGWELDLTPSMSFLTDTATQYPVTIDPTVTDYTLGDTYYSNGGTVNHTADYNLYVGTQDSGTTVDRIYLNWNTAKFVGRDITSADLKLFQYDANSCSAKSNWTYPTTTYSSNDSNNVHINPDAAWASYSATNTGAAGCSPAEPNGYVTLNQNRIVPGWVTGELQQYAMEIRAGSETDNTWFKRFCSQDAAPTGTGHCEGTTGVPQLVINYVWALGVQPHEGAVLTHKLNDRSTLSVNTQDGDAVLHATDAHFAGRGLNLTIDRFYNSLAGPASSGPETGAFGPGWAMSVGPDVQLRRYGDNDHFDYASPAGTRYGRFFRNTSGDTNGFHNPTFGGIDADLHDDAATTTAKTFTMTFHSGQEKYQFSDLGCSTCNLLLIKDSDTHGNAITYKYNGSGSSAQLTQIIDTHGRTFGVSYGSNGYITSITETTTGLASPRTWTYHYNASNQLDSYTDPTGARTDYAYDSNGELSQITDPAQTDGKRPTAALTYSNGQLTAAGYQTSAAGGTSGTATYSYTYGAPSSVCGNTPSGTGSWSYMTTVNDPNGHATEYCYQDRQANPDPNTPNGADTNAEQLRVVDGAGHHRSTSYTPDMSALQSTSQANDGSSTGSTVYAYNTNNTVSSATAPLDQTTTTGEAAGATSFDYSGSTGAAAYRPSSGSTAGGSCSSMKYNSSTGDLTDVYTGQGAGSTSTLCTTTTSGRHSHVDYNGDGTIKDEYSPVVAAAAGAGTPASADETLYTYGSTEPHAGELTQVVRPGGVVTTSYSYDDRGRVASTTDGNGNKTAYSYDGDDRITQVLTGGATTCTPASGSCIQYSYDGEGNLTTRVDAVGTTTFTFDWLNNPATQTQPDGTALTTVYDGVSNLTKYTQTLPGQLADSVNYAYNAANQIATVTDSTGTFTYSYDTEGKVASLALPTSSAVSYGYKYTQHSAKFKGITVTGGTNIPSYSNYFTAGTQETNRSQQLTVTLNGSNTYYNYAYDSDDHLKSVTPSPTTAAPTYSYTYDADGNVRSATTASTTTYYGYNENDQLCWSGPTDSSSAAMGRTCAATPSGDTTYASDNAGENLGPSSGPIHYNPQQQVDQISSTTGAGPVSQTYLDQGNNLRLTAGNITYTQGTKLGTTAQSVSSYGTGTTFYTRDPNGQILDEHGAAGTYYYLVDRLGSTMALIDTAGAYAGGYTYDPYGKTTTANGTSTTAANNNPWRYSGGYQDPTDGYYHLGARYYDAAGQFTQADSIGGSLLRPEKYNGYAYAAGDPINNSDPLGNVSGGLTASACAIICLELAFGLEGNGSIYGTGTLGIGAEIGLSGGITASTDNPEGAAVGGDCAVTDGIGGALGGSLSDSGEFAAAGEVGAGLEDGCSLNASYTIRS